MKIGVLGSGGVGQSLGEGFRSVGHDVRVAHRDDFGETAGWCEAAVLATPWSGTENALRLAGPERLAGKTLIDVTNPLAYGDKGPTGLVVGGDDSAAESIARWAPGANVVKAFNTVGHELMFRPSFPDGAIPDMFYCGDDEGAKTLVAGVIRDFGWNPVDVGGLAAARMLESLAMLWITLGVRGNGWTNAITLLRGGTGRSSARTA